jgi:truncated hemoglobin YjbI
MVYDGIEVDAVLRPLFGRDLATERESQKRFFTDWLGGEGKGNRSAPSAPRRKGGHLHVRIGRGLAIP